MAAALKDFLMTVDGASETRVETVMQIFAQDKVVGAATGSIYSDHIRGSGVITTQTILFQHREHHRAELQLVLSSFDFWH